eukprot:3317776-Pyramimonas_sp.AAC.1
MVPLAFRTRVSNLFHRPCDIHRVAALCRRAAPSLLCRAHQAYVCAWPLRVVARRQVGGNTRIWGDMAKEMEEGRVDIKDVLRLLGR